MTIAAGERDDAQFLLQQGQGDFYPRSRVGVMNGKWPRGDIKVRGILAKLM